MKIEPITAFGVTMVNLDIGEVQVDIFAKRALCNVVFSAEDGTRFPRQITLEGNDYTAWGNDDNYIVEMILGKSAVTKAAVVDAPESTPDLKAVKGDAA